MSEDRSVIRQHLPEYQKATSAPALHLCLSVSFAHRRARVQRASPRVFEQLGYALYDHLPAYIHLTAARDTCGHGTRCSCYAKGDSIESPIQGKFSTPMQPPGSARQHMGPCPFAVWVREARRKIQPKGSLRTSSYILTT